MNPEYQFYDGNSELEYDCDLDNWYEDELRDTEYDLDYMLENDYPGTSPYDFDSWPQ